MIEKVNEGAARGLSEKATALLFDRDDRCHDWFGMTPARNECRKCVTEEIAKAIAARDAEWSHAVSESLTHLERLAEGVCKSLETSPLGRLMDASAASASEGGPK